MKKVNKHKKSKNLKNKSNNTKIEFFIRKIKSKDKKFIAYTSLLSILFILVISILAYTTFNTLNKKIAEQNTPSGSFEIEGSSNPEIVAILKDDTGTLDNSGQKNQNNTVVNNNTTNDSAPKTNNSKDQQTTTNTTPPSGGPAPTYEPYKPPSCDTAKKATYENQYYTSLAIATDYHIKEVDRISSKYSNDSSYQLSKKAYEIDLENIRYQDEVWNIDHTYKNNLAAIHCN